MKNRTLALGGAAAIAFAGLLSLTPAVAHTSQPATPEEIQQTDALNAQALANARTGDATAPRTLANTDSTDTNSTATPNSSATPPAQPTPTQPTPDSTTPNGTTGGTNP
jgi:hypothetical protein